MLFLLIKIENIIYLIINYYMYVIINMEENNFNLESDFPFELEFNYAFEYLDNIEQQTNEKLNYLENIEEFNINITPPNDDELDQLLAQLRQIPFLLRNEFIKNYKNNKCDEICSDNKFSTISEKNIKRQIVNLQNKKDEIDNIRCNPHLLKKLNDKIINKSYAPEA